MQSTFPQVITHEKVLVDCDEECKNFLTAIDILGDKLGPLLFQSSLVISTVQYSSPTQNSWRG